MSAAIRDATVVLVVEDDERAREFFRAALRQAGYAVFAVDDGLDALKYLELNTPAAVVLDLDLPRVGGLDVHREMVAQGLTPAVPVIIVTGTSSDLDERSFACVLRKPIDAEQLLAAVRRCLSRPPASSRP